MPSTPTATIDPYALDRDGLTALLADLDQPAYRGAQVHEWLVKGVDDPHDMTNLPAPLRDVLAGRFAPARPELVDHRVADDGRTHKLLLALPDDSGTTEIEAVLMLYPARDGPGRATVCVSTQAGCALGCPFCATGQAGLTRNLTAGEVVRQVVVADAALRSGRLLGAPLFGQSDPTTSGAGGASPEARSEASTHGAVEQAQDHDGRGMHDVSAEHARRITNVVFMGMGEPLANQRATFDAVRWLHDPAGFGLSARRITVSTVGLVPGIRRLAEVGLPVTLAVSLHAANDALRDDLVPINRTHPLAEVEAAIVDYREATNRRVTLEWCLIGDVNDGERDARELAAFARRVRSHVNVIPMNPTPGVRWREPTAERTQAFMAALTDAGANATLRDTRGRDADAACGQLLASYQLGAGNRLPAALGAARRIDDRRGGGSRATTSTQTPLGSPEQRGDRDG